MNNLWILTEERPKNSVVLTILQEYCKLKNETLTCGDIKIKPKTQHGLFSFEYVVEGANIGNISEINIKIISGYSSFMDYMLVEQEKVPANHSLKNIVFLLEETKMYTTVTPCFKEMWMI